mmetsp:Transcript_63302/g.150993  ORF Transcript_63302/g.150993 Transcript_63302/m.150993 type:complete len:299 (+) Transcript_63302:112-1008(+)
MQAASSSDIEQKDSGKTNDPAVRVGNASRCFGNCWHLLVRQKRVVEAARKSAHLRNNYGATGDTGGATGEERLDVVPLETLEQRREDRILIEETAEIVKTTCCVCEYVMVVPSVILGIIMLYIGLTRNHDGCFGRNRLGDVFRATGLLNLLVALTYAMTCRGGQRAFDFLRDWVLQEHSFIHNDVEAAKELGDSSDAAWREAIGWSLCPGLLLILCVLSLDVCWIYGISQAAVASQQEAPCFGVLTLFWALFIVDMLFQCCAFLAGGPLAVLSILWSLSTAADAADFPTEYDDAKKPQ